MATTIAIVERYPLSRAGLAHFLNSHFSGSSILEYENVSELNKSHGHRHRPELIILGLNSEWPERGLVQLGSLRSSYPKAKVLIYDDPVDSDKALKYLKGGAWGYLSKSDVAVNLKAAIDKVLEGKRYVDKEILDLIFDTQIFGLRRRSDHKHVLSHTELIVAKYLIEGLKVTRIAALLGRNISTVSTFKKRIFMKLDITNVLELEAKIRTKKNHDSVLP